MRLEEQTRFLVTVVRGFRIRATRIGEKQHENDILLL
jgi:hypothetical protein